MLSNVVAHASQFEMHVASLIASETDRMMPYFRTAKLPIHFLSYSSDFYAPEILPNLRKLITVNQYDAVHCWLFQAIVQGVMICRSLKIPCIADPQIMRNILSFGMHRKWEQFLIGETLRNSDVVLFNSTSAALDFLEAGVANPGSVRVVRSGVDCDHFTPFLNEGDALVCIGRLAAEKGYYDLRSVLLELHTQFPQLKCLAAGTGERPKLDPIEFVGHVDDVRSFLSKGCIYITTSHAEGLSNALLEAQACGLPAIARRIGPNAEVIEHGKTGFLCKTNEEFVKAVRALFTNPELRRTMGNNARARMESRFSITSRAQEFESLYSELL